MNIKETSVEIIKQLIDNYFEGKTSCDEEKFLQNYFSQTHTDPSLDEYKALFAAWHQVSVSPPVWDDKRSIHPNKTKSIYKNHFTRRVITLSSIAASIAALFLIIFLTHNPTKNMDYVIINGVTYTDSKKIETAMNTSLANVKIETQDIFSELDDLDLE